MRDLWENRLREKLSSLRMDEETPSWDDFSLAMGRFPKAPSGGKTGWLLLHTAHRWRAAAAALLLLLAGAGFYHLFRIEPARESVHLLPKDAISNHQMIATTPPAMAVEKAAISLFHSPSSASLSGLSEADSTSFSHPSLPTLEGNSSVLSEITGTPSTVGLSSGEERAVEEIVHLPGIDPKFSDGEWSVALYAYGQGSWGQRGLESSMERMGTFLSEQSADMQLSAPRLGALHHSPPLVLGMKLRQAWNTHWGWETGLQFSRYRSSGTLEGEMVHYAYRQTVDYVGLPLGLFYRLFRHQTWSLTPIAGLMAETALSAKGVLRITSDGGVTPSESYRLDANGILLSAYSGAELSARIAGNWWLTAEPGITLPISGASQPATYRTEHDLFFRVVFGIRCDF